jgi:hypothetical protein
MELQKLQNPTIQMNLILNPSIHVVHHEVPKQNQKQNVIYIEVIINCGLPFIMLQNNYIKSPLLHLVALYILILLATNVTKQMFIVTFYKEVCYMSRTIST